jgi:hypothetical protein
MGSLLALMVGSAIELCLAGHVKHEEYRVYVRT